MNARSDDGRPIRRRGGSGRTGAPPFQIRYGPSSYFRQVAIFVETPLCFELLDEGQWRVSFSMLAEALLMLENQGGLYPGYDHIFCVSSKEI